MSLPKTSSAQRKAEELVKCGRDPIYFIKEYCKIENNGLRDFELWPFQEDAINDYLKYDRNIILKSRQIGMSTVTAAYAAWLFLFYPHSNILVIATKLSTAKIFIRKVKTILKYLPSWMKLSPITKETQQELENDQGCILKAAPTGDDVGRGESLSLLIVDEAAFIKDFEAIWTGLQPTLSTSKGRVIILSTPNGVGNMYHKLYEKSAKDWEGKVPGEKGCNNFNGIYLPWTVVPERDQAWYDEQIKDLTPTGIAQELECSFVGSGANVIHQEYLDKLRKNVKRAEFREGWDRGLWIWQKPKAGHNYIISADVSRGDSKDYSTFVVIDVQEGAVVAEYKGKSPPDRLAEMLDEIGRKYNNGVVAVEKNSYGYATLMKLRDFKYPNIYYPENKLTFATDYVYSGDIAKAGFDTNGKTKPAIIAKLEEVIRNEQIILPSDRLIAELQTYIWHKNGKAGAMKSYNDDLVMATAIGVWLYDASEYSKDVMETNQIMFESMGAQTTQIQDINTDGSVLGGKDEFSIWAPVPGSGVAKTDTMNRRSGIQQRVSKAWDWLLK